MSRQADTEHTYENTSRVLDTDQGKLHYHEAGAGEPLLLLHGSGPGVFGWANFRGNLALFAQHFHTYILDMPGYGGSDPAEGNPIQVSVEGVVRFMDKLGLQKVRIVGNSLGGGIGAQVAALHPDRVDRLCTIGGVGINLFTAFPAEGINLLVDFTEAPSREKLISWLRSMVYDQSLVTEELIEERWKRATEPNTLAASRKMYSRPAIQAIATHVMKSTLPLAHLPNIKCPTLITWGRDDRVSPMDMAFVPMRLIPKCELHIFHDCGHWAMIERKAEFESVVLAFLTR